MNKYLYHLTDPESLPEIMKNGLQPMIGPRSRSVNDTEACICLCRWKDIPYWGILLGQKVVLQVQINKNEAEEYQYDGYGEFVTKEVIHPERIKRVYVPTYTEKAMIHLCTSYLYSFSHLCVDFARFYNGADFVDKDRLNQQICALKAVVPKLDYTVLPKKDIRAELKLDGESGGCTFVDRYLGKETRLYEQLLLYPDDEFLNDRKWMNKIIKKLFKGCLKVNTGGWSEWYCYY